MSSTADAEIRSLVSRYAQATNGFDAAAWSATWAEEGAWELMGATRTGRAAVVAQWEALMGNIQFVYQLPGEGSIEIDGGEKRATGRFPTVEFCKLDDGPGTLMLGTYHDVYVIEGGAWRFAERRMKIGYMGPTDMSGAPIPTLEPTPEHTPE